MIETLSRPMIEVRATVTLKEHCAVLPAASVTLKVFVVVPAGNVPPLGTPAIWVVTAPGQLSAPTGVAYVTNAPLTAGSKSAMMSDGQVIVGNCMSLTVTVNEQLAVLFEASIAVHVTVVVPFWNVEPVAGLQP